MVAELLACESAYLWCVTVTVHKHFQRILARAHQWVQAKVINYVQCRTEEMVADVFTKPMEESLFNKFMKTIFNEDDTYENYD